MAVSYKAIALSNSVLDKLKARLNGSLTAVQSFDTDGYPLINIGPGTAGSASFLIKIAAASWPKGLDALGLAQNVFTPHIIQLATEADYAGATDNVADPTTRAQLGLVLGQLFGMGCQLDWYES